jgi:hypothetical protein
VEAALTPGRGRCSGACERPKVGAGHVVVCEGVSAGFTWVVPVCMVAMHFSARMSGSMRIDSVGLCGPLVTSTMIAMAKADSATKFA